MKNLNFETVFKDAQKFTLGKEDSYTQAYPEFLKYFDSIKSGGINEHHLIISSHFVYGWMPTIIHLNLIDKTQVISLLNLAKDGQILSLSDLEVLKSAINNSLVGLSKLLHFINPKVYAIWDSRIFRYLTAKKSSYGIDKPELYLEYLEGIQKISFHPEYPALHSLISEYFEYKIQPTRAIEITMFEADRRNQRQIKDEL